VDVSKNTHGAPYYLVYLVLQYVFEINHSSSLLLLLLILNLICFYDSFFNIIIIMFLYSKVIAKELKKEKSTNIYIEKKK
jgi:hypothetical protein